MPDNRPEYETYKRPSIGTCLVRIVLAYLFVIVVYGLFLLVVPSMRNALTYPVLAILLLILVVGGGYYLLTDRKRRQEHAAELAAQSKSRAVSDDWVAKELAESPYHAADAAAEAPATDDTPEEQA